MLVRIDEESMAVTEVHKTVGHYDGEGIVEALTN